MNPNPELRKRVRDGELTEQVAEDIAAEIGDREREVAWDRKTEKEIKENERKNLP